MTNTATAEDVTLQMVPLSELHADPDNVRTDATPDEGMVQSIREYGILQPPVVEPDPAGGYIIAAGNRRVGGALLAGLTETLVIVRPAGSKKIRTEQQIIENERRSSLTAQDLAAGYQTIALFGDRPEDIAARLGEKPERVRAGLKIQNSAAAAELVASNPTIDLDRAAFISEFDDHPKLQQKLIDTATLAPQNFDRDLANARTQREVDARVAKLKEQLDAADVVLAGVATYDEYYWRGKDGMGKSLDKLGIRPEEHLECPGHAAVIHKAQSYYLKDDPSEWLMYVCTDWEGNSHTLPATTSSLTPEELAAREERDRERAAAAAEWKAKQEIIAANTTARQMWIHQHITTGRLRPVVAHFDLQALALAASTEASDWPPVHVALSLITGEPHTRDWRNSDNEDELVRLATEPSTPSVRVIIGNAFAALEDALESRFAVKYFTLLQTLGYTLTDTDQEHLQSAINAEATWLAEQAGEPVVDDEEEDDDEEGDE